MGLQDTISGVAGLHDQPSGRDVTRRAFVTRAGALLVASSAGTALLSACGGGSTAASTSNAASSHIGGVLDMLVWEGYDDPKASAAFKAKYGVTVRADYLETNPEVITKLLAGGASRTALATPNLALTPLMAQAGVLDPTDWSQVPNTADYIPRIAAFAKTNFAVNGQTYGFPYQWGINGLVYNAKYVSQAPKSFLELTKPEFTNKIALTDVAEDNYQCWAKILGYDPLHMSSAELAKVTNYLINLKKTHVRVFSSNYDQLAQALATGDVVAVASPFPSSMPELARKHGSNTVKFVLPSVGGQTWTDSWALPKGGPNQATALAWINFMLSPKANAMVATDNQYGTVNRRGIDLTSGVARSAYPYNNPELNKLAPPWSLPRGGSGSVTWQNWLTAWKSVEAA